MRKALQVYLVLLVFALLTVLFGQFPQVGDGELFKPAPAEFPDELRDALLRAHCEEEAKKWWRFHMPEECKAPSR